MKIDGPTQFDNVLDAAIEDVELYIAARSIEEVETHAANAAVVKPLQFPFRRRFVNPSDPAKIPAGVFDRVEGRRIIQAMHARLHDDGALDADDREHFLIVLQGSGGGRGILRRRKRKFFRRTTDG